MTGEKHTEVFTGRDACDALVLGYFAFGFTELGPPTLISESHPSG